MADQLFLSKFSKAIDDMIAASGSAFLSASRASNSTTNYKKYTLKEIQDIIANGNLQQQQLLSRAFFERNSFYKRIILYYATLLKNVGVVIPNPSYGKSLSTKDIQKRYFQAIGYVDIMNLETILTEITLKVLVDGIYFGLIKQVDKNHFTIMDLPTQYCQTRFKTGDGRSIVEFDVTYFNTIYEKKYRDRALKAYPSEVQKAYRRYQNGKLKEKWIFLDSSITFCFSFFNTFSPLFLGIIPSIVDYEDAVDNEKERDLEEIRKILVQHIPHLNDGTLLFEPEEAAVMHKGSVNMLKGNKNISVLTTYADADAIVSKTSSDTATNNLQKMLTNVYANTGVSTEVFNSTSSLTMSYSIKNDIALMMVLGNKYSIFVAAILNRVFGNQNVQFMYKLLPVSIYTENEYTDEMFKLAQSGYSFIMPAVAMGISQRSLMNIKELENDILKLSEVLIPLASSYTQSGSGDGQVGRPKKPLEELSSKTEANQKSIENGGGAKDE